VQQGVRKEAIVIKSAGALRRERRDDINGTILGLSLTFSSLFGSWCQQTR
jgi:hypothetical protein